MEILQDDGCTISQDEILELRTQFSPYNRNLLNNTVEGYWVRFSIWNELQLDEKVYLNTAYFDSIEVYRLTEGNALTLEDKSGFLVPRKDYLPVVHRTNLSLFSIPSKVKSTFYVRIYAKSNGAREVAAFSLSEGFDILTPPYVQSTFFNLRDHSVLISGALFIMFLFNLFLAIKGSDSVYIFLAFYNLGFCLTGLNSFGYSMSIGLSDSYELIRSLHFYLPYSLIIVYLGFVVRFLELKKRAPFIFKLTISIGILVTSAMIVHIIGFSFIAVSIIEPVAIIGFFILIGAAIRAYRKGYKPAIYIIIGSILLSIFFINYILGILNESRDYYIGEFLILVGAFIELLIFTFAVVQKFSNTQKRAVELNTKKQFLEEQTEELKEEVEQKSKDLTSKIAAETSQYQQQKELLELLNSMDVSSNELQRARLIARRLTADTAFNDDFLIHFNGVHKGFTDRLLQKHPDLTANEIKLCAYLRMNLTSLEIAALQGVEKTSVNQARYRLRSHLSLAKEIDLIVYLCSI